MPVLGLLLAMALAKLMHQYSAGFAIIPPEKIVGAKLAFLSVMMGLGMFQYKFLYDEMREFSKQAYADDYGSQWTERKNGLKAKKDALDEYLASTASAEQANGDRELALRDAVDTELQWFKDTYGKIALAINKLLVEYSVRLSVAFTIGFTLLASIAIDLTRMWWPAIDTPYLGTLAQAALLCAIAELLALLVLFVGAVRHNVKEIGDIVDQLGTVAQS